jgi:hypothetical protein
MSSPINTSDSGRTDALLRLLLSTETFDAFLHELTLLTVAALPEGSTCGITVARDSQPATIANSDSLALAVDQIQYRTGEGPCLNTLTSRQVHYICDTSTEPRWRPFCAEAFAHGVRSCLSLPLPLLASPGTAAGYNLYNVRPDAFDDDDRARMQVFIDTATGAVSLALRIADQAKLNADLRNTLASRTVIDQAIGIMMAQQRCPATEAFALLSRASQNRNVKLHDLAVEIVAAVGGHNPEPATDTFEAPD